MAGEGLKDGGPAFPSKADETIPHPTYGSVDQSTCYLGMSLRDWFAGQALALLDSAACERPENVARLAYLVADAMLAHREE